jgi:hypothetical protein
MREKPLAGRTVAPEAQHTSDPQESELVAVH